jgi:hypothetical protein
VMLIGQFNQPFVQWVLQTEFGGQYMC